MPDQEPPIERRKRVDPIINDIHVMVGQLVERSKYQQDSLEKHIEWSERTSRLREEQMKEVRDRLQPLEDFHGSAKTAGKVLRRTAFALSGPSILGFGSLIWMWISKKLGHVPHIP